MQEVLTRDRCNIASLIPVGCEAGVPGRLCRELSLRRRCKGGLGTPTPVISRFSKPSPIRWFERGEILSPFYAAFRPLFWQVGRWSTGIPLGHPFERLHCGASSVACWEETKGSIPELDCPTETQTVQEPELCPRQGQSGFSQISTNSSGTIRINNLAGT